MRRIGMLLVSCCCLHFSMPAWADLANCDGPTTPEEAERRQMLKDADPLGLNPIYAAADGLLEACEKAKSTINSAVESLSGSTSTHAAGSSVDDTSAATPAAVQASAPRAPMSRNVARIERDRVADLDDKAASLVQSNCGGFGCSRLLETQVDPVIREAEALNANPEYLAHMPKYGPIASVEAAARFGWTRQDGYWVQAPPQARPGANTGTLGAYLLSADECKKLRDTLDREIKANASKEPDNLSFFEGECVPQVASYAEDVKSWRALLATRPPLPPVADVPVNAPELAQWHDDLVAEENRQVAEAEEKKRIEAERLAEEAAAQQQAKLAAAESARKSMPASSQYSSVCARNETKVQKVIGASGYGDYSGFALENEEKIRLFASLHEPCAADASSRSPGTGESSRAIVEGLNRALEIHRQNCANWGADCSRYYYDQHSGAEADSTRNYMQLYRGEVRKALSDPNYSADLEPANSNTQLARASQGSGDGNCEAKLRAIDDQVGASTAGCDASATCNLQAAMWGLSQMIGTVERYCPSGGLAAQLPGWRKQLEDMTTNCNQIQSGGRQCVPKL